MSDNKHPTSKTGAQREKMNEPPYDLIPFQEIADSYTRVAEYGVKKYAAWNWFKGIARVQLLCSLLRHSFAYIRGEECDRESGLNHTDHILWNAAALVHSVRWNLEDGRRAEPKRDYYRAPIVGMDLASQPDVTTVWIASIDPRVRKDHADEQKVWGGVPIKKGPSALFGEVGPEAIMPLMRDVPVISRAGFTIASMKKLWNGQTVDTIVIGDKTYVFNNKLNKYVEQ